MNAVCAWHKLSLSFSLPNILLSETMLNLLCETTLNLSVKRATDIAAGSLVIGRSDSAMLLYWGPVSRRRTSFRPPRSPR